MRKYFLLPILSLALIVFGLSSCDELEVADTVSPDGYPVATFTTDFTGSEVSEGDTIIYTVTLDKMIEYGVSVTVMVDESSTFDVDYLEVIDASIPAYATEGQLMIVFHDNSFPDQTASLKFELGIATVAQKYLVNASTVFPTMEVAVKNVNNPTLLTVVFGWDSEDDYDIVTWSNTADYPLTEWGADGATGANPETDMAIWLSDPVGEYYVNVMNWGAPSVNYVFTIGHPDGSVQTIEGFFDADNTDSYINDPWTAWGDAYDSFRVLKVVNDGEKFVVTKL